MPVEETPFNPSFGLSAVLTAWAVAAAGAAIAFNPSFGLSAVLTIGTQIGNLGNVFFQSLIRA